MELSQSKSEQRDYLKNVELARVLNKRAKRKQQIDGENSTGVGVKRAHPEAVEPRERKRPVRERTADDARQLDGVLSRIF